MANHFSLDYDETSSPLSSNIEQTPPSQRKPLFTLPPSFNQSSTPAGPPPSQKSLFSDRPTHFSTTPAGPPPSSTYGGSTMGGRKLQFKAPSDSPPTKNGQGKRKTQLPPRPANGTPARPRSKPGPGFHSGLASSRPMFAHSEESPDHEDSMEEEEDDELDAPTLGRTNQFEASTRSQNTLFKSSMGGHSHPRPLSRKRVPLPKASHLPRKGNEDVVPGIARNLASHSSVAALEEPEDLVIHSEEVMQRLAEQTRRNPDPEDAAKRTTERVADLIQFWRTFIHPETPSLSNARIGPLETASGLEKANFMASLLLMLHHRPSVAEPSTRRAGNRSLTSTSQEFAPVPLILLEWLDNYHLSYANQFNSVRTATPNCTAHDYFWDTLRSLVMRGKLRQVIHLLEQADFQYAVTAKDDGAHESGYHGSQLQAVHGVINRARQVLGVCPAVEGHWETTDDEWSLYRKRVSAEIEHLAELADDDLDEDEEDDEFRADNFGMRRPGGTLMQSMRKPANRLPLTIYQNLKMMYNMLLGSVEEIMDQSQDWLEAATSLTVWWDGSEDDEITSWSKNVSSNITGIVASDDAYLSRLSAAFLCVTDPEDVKSLQINTMSSAEVGLGAVLQGDHASVLRILRTLSLPLASVVAEIGLLSGWLNTTSSVRPGQLDQEDLIVLNYAAPPSGISKDDVLSEYAEALFERPELHSSNGTVVEGWELALSVASRFDNTAHIRSATSDFLDRLDLNSQERMDKLVGLCSALGFEEEAQKVCEKYADHLVNNTSDYGTALLCYARSHASNKLRQVMDLLVSYCLVQSKAYPPEDEMDSNLRALVASPKTALTGFIDVDPEAAEMLQFYLVGYACIRRFYALRDEEVVAASNNTKACNRPIARRRFAAKALLAAINSAADSIYGGLYDAERQSAIQVDGLLTLLGEATAFLANLQEKPVLSTIQLYALLAAIEDLQTVNPRVYGAAEECLQAALRQFHGSQPPSPHAMLKKSMSSGRESNFSFSLMGSEMLAGSATSAGGKSVGSAFLVNGDKGDGRGWDWRGAFKDRGQSGKDVLRCLRVGIARELAVSDEEVGG